MGPCSSEDRRVLDFSSVTHSTGNQRSSRTGECRKEVEPSIVKTVKARTHVGFFKLTFYLPLQWWWMYSYFLYITYNTYFTFASSLYCLSAICCNNAVIASYSDQTIDLSIFDRRSNAKQNPILVMNEQQSLSTNERRRKKSQPSETSPQPNLETTFIIPSWSCSVFDNLGWREDFEIL